MNYDDWKATAQDADDCTEDAETCECPECRAWRDNREPRPLTFDEALGNVCDERERVAAAVRLKR